MEQYFNYMGCLAVEGTYDRMYALLDGAPLSSKQRHAFLRSFPVVHASCALSPTALTLDPAVRPAANIPAIDIILLFAAAEADLPKLEELLAAGADANVKDLAGMTPMQLAGKANPAKKADAEALIAKYVKK